MSKIIKFTILGERCSGTNYLENLVQKNLDIIITWEYGWKHFFGFSDYSKADDTLFIGIYRNLLDMLDSLYVEHHHLPHHLRREYGCDPSNFLQKECFSYDDHNYSLDQRVEIMEDRNIYTKERYNNILEMRATKMKFLLNDMKNRTKNYILISYEDLVKNWDKFLLDISQKYNIRLKNSIPVNHEEYKSFNRIKFKNVPRKKKVFTYDMIKDNKYYDENIERDAGYVYN